MLSLLDRTVTAAGSRLLASWLGSPLLSAAEINDRLDVLQFFIQNGQLMRQLRTELGGTFDVVRCLQRLSLGRGNPRDLHSIATTLVNAQALLQVLLSHAQNTSPSHASSSAPSSLPPSFTQQLLQLDDLSGLGTQIHQALSEGAFNVLSTQSGGFIAKGHSPELDELRQLATHGEQAIQAIQQQFRQQTNLKGLKVRFNNIIGYFAEVQASALLPPFPDGGPGPVIPQDFVLLQHLPSGYVRYKPRELSDLELALQRAENQAVALEAQLFDRLRLGALERSPAIRELAHALARIDVALALAELSRDHAYVRPVLLEEPASVFRVQDGRHPLVESAQTSDSARPSTFVPNDCALSPDTATTAVITGPNMGGKSTFLRQNALITIMAQIGCYVPARSAELSIVDSIFSRVGSSDDLSNNMSTFMVEMIETSTIVSRAGPRSLVIMDEVGRGTSTQDGLSIACAVLEHLHTVNKARILFATHYRELAEMEKYLAGLCCLTMEVIELATPLEAASKILFTHKVIPGVADCSYGIHCAQLAGLPASILNRAHGILQSLSNVEKDPAILFSSKK